MPDSDTTVTRPEKDTPEYALWVAAIEVAIRAPLRQGTSVFAALVPWTTINEVRDALDGVGIDWRTAKAKQDRDDARASGKAVP